MNGTCRRFATMETDLNISWDLRPRLSDAVATATHKKMWGMTSGLVLYPSSILGIRVEQLSQLLGKQLGQLFYTKIAR